MTYKARQAVEEIVANIVHHGYAERDGSILVQADVEPRHLRIIIEDSGEKFDLRSLDTPEDIQKPLDQRSSGGLGVFLVLQNVDGYEHEYVNGRNRNILYFNRERDIHKTSTAQIESKTHQISRITLEFVSGLVKVREDSDTVGQVIDRVVAALAESGIELSADVRPFVDKLKESVAKNRIRQRSHGREVAAVPALD